MAITLNIPLLPETTAYLANCPTVPSASWINALNTLIRSLILNGNWSNLDRLWIFATPAGCQSNAHISVVNPTSTPITEVNSPSWTANKGYTGNGTNSYLNSNFNAHTQGVKFTLNNNSYGVYSVSNATPTTNQYQFGAGDATSNYNLIQTGFESAGQYTTFVYNNTAGNAVSSPSTSTQPLALVSTSRISSTNIAIYNRGSATTSGAAQTSSVIPNLNSYILGVNLNGTLGVPSVEQVALVFVGGGGLNQSTFYTEIQAFATAIGFNV